jgi:hypothetical protein
MGKLQPLSASAGKPALKRNELRDFLEEAGDWTKAHLENVLIGSVVLALLAFGGIYFLKNRREEGIKAAIQFSSAEQYFNRALSGNEQNVMEASRSGFDQVRAGFEGRDEAVAAELRLADLSFQKGAFEEARSAYERFGLAHSGSPFAPLAEAGKASSLEGLGKIKEAGDAYAAVALKYPGSANTALCLADAARCFWAAGDKASFGRAVESLSRLASENKLPDTLKSRLQAFKAKLGKA